MVLHVHDKASYEIRILSADPFVRQLFVDEIAEAGHLVAATAGVPVDAADDAVDLVLVDDAMLPVLDTKLLARIGAAWPHASVAVLTSGDRDTNARGLPTIARDARTPELIAAIEAAARGTQVHLGPQARASRMELFVRKIASHPAMAGVGRGLPAVYGDSVAREMPGAMSKILGRLSSGE